MISLYLSKRQILYSSITSLLLTIAGNFIVYSSIAYSSEATTSVNSPSLSNDHPTPSTAISTQIEFVPPPSDGSPDQTRGAGARDGQRCSQDVAVRSTTPSTRGGAATSLSALVPPTNYGLTYMEHPTVWVYLPQTSAQQGIISIREEDGRPYAQLSFDLPASDTVIGIQLPETLPPLQVGKNYQWAIVLVCGATPQPSDPVVTAWIRRESRPIPDATGLNPIEQIHWYSQHGIWYDALTTLAQSRQSSPQDVRLTRLWINFLAQPHLHMEAIAIAPLHPLTLP